MYISECQVNISERQVYISECQVNISECQVNISERQVNISERQVNISECQVKVLQMNDHFFQPCKIIGNLRSFDRHNVCPAAESNCNRRFTVITNYDVMGK